jgi:hypothetical protein
MKRAALALLLVTGCTPAPGLVYDIHIDPGMAAAEQQMALDAIDVWDAATDHRMTLSVVVAPCDGASDAICIHDATLPTGSTYDALTTWHPSGLQDVAMYADSVDPSWYQQVVEHELGHAFGLSHDECGTVMYHKTSECQSGHVTPADVAQFWKVRQ